jgi:murein DD-endopeptidase MepM/ murein hydrolase activator NlpD
MSRLHICLISFSLLIAGAVYADDDVFTPVDVGAPTVTESTVTTSTDAVPAPPEEAEPFVFPLKSAKVKIVSGFGRRNLQKLAKALETASLPDAEFHEGVDFAVNPGAQVVAARSGKVLFAGFSTAYVSRKNKKEKSRFIIIRHADGLSTRYVHLNRIEVTPQEEVSAGDVIGTAAESDEWSQPVLHFEVRQANGKPANPAKYLPAPGQVASGDQYGQPLRPQGVRAHHP